MLTRVISANEAEHYIWGGTHGAHCDGWHLVKAADLSIIEELMPAGAREERHYHVEARQFFYVLEGELTMEVDREAFRIAAGRGLEVAPGLAHQAMNESQETLRMIVISSPPSHGDRTTA